MNTGVAVANVGSQLPQAASDMLRELAAMIETGSLGAVHTFGPDLGACTAQHADVLLEQAGRKIWTSLADVCPK